MHVGDVAVHVSAEVDARAIFNNIRDQIVLDRDSHGVATEGGGGNLFDKTAFKPSLNGGA